MFCEFIGLSTPRGSFYHDWEEHRLRAFGNRVLRRIFDLRGRN
jgi:hypothetical protein